MLSATNNLMSVQYRAKQFTNTRGKDYIKVLSIYSSNMAPALKTNTNEITHWLDNARFHNDGRQFFVFGLYKNDDVIGYAQFIYLKSKRIVIIDYVVIEESERKLGSFFQFIDLIKNHIERTIDFDYILAEIGYLTNSKIPSDYSKSLIKLIKIVGFGVIDADYFQPQLSPDNPESQMPAQLMVYMKPSMDQVKRDTYISWVHTMFFDHYLEWYKPFKSSKELESYKNEISSLLNAIKAKIPTYVKIFSSNSEPVIPIKRIRLKEVKTRHFSKFLKLLACLIFFILSFMLIWFYTKMNTLELLFVYTVLLCLILLVYSIFNKKARNSARSLLQLIKLFFDKLK